MASDWIKRPLPDLDLYLAHAFIRHPTVWAELASRGADRAAAEATYNRIRSKDTHQLSNWTLSRYTDRFGPPSTIRDYMYLWSLALWPEHYWRCNRIEIGDKHPLIISGIELRVPRQVARITPLSFSTALNELRIGYDTRDEVQSALGDPDESEGGWTPRHDLRYDLPDWSVIDCVLAHGVLVELELLTERPSWAPRNPTS